MREIKFRGKGIGSNDYCYGIGYADGVIFDPVGRNTIRYHVDPESVAQLVGHDSNGREVYEGDKLADKVGNIWFAKSTSYAIYESGCEDIASDLDELTLVEAE